MILIRRDPEASLAIQMPDQTLAIAERLWSQYGTPIDIERHIGRKATWLLVKVFFLRSSLTGCKFK